MLEGLLGGLIDKEKATHNTIKDALEDLAEELNLPFSSFFIMIKPTNEEFNFKCYVYTTSEGAPKFVREITLKEILKIE